jgi:hypothetical protein
MLFRVSVYPPYRLLNAWINIYDTWYVHHDTWAHLNGVHHKSLPSTGVSVYVSPIVARQRLSKKSYRGNIYTRDNGRIVGRVTFYAVRVISKEIRWLFLLRTSCFLSTPNKSLYRVESGAELAGSWRKLQRFVQRILFNTKFLVTGRRGSHIF